MTDQPRPLLSLSFPPLRHLSVAAAAAVALLACTQSDLGAQDAGTEQEKEKEKATPKNDSGLPAPFPLGKAATEALVARYQTSDHWVQKTVILLSLNHYWHPAGSTMILEAVRNKDRRIRAYGVEALLRSEKGLLPNVVSPELLDELINKQLNLKNSHYRKRLLLALARIAPAAKAKTKSEWGRWWRANKETWKPGEWKPREIPKKDLQGGTVAAADRAFDLYNSGLDMAICIDSTGSMQPTIDALASALGQMVDILDGVSPKFRLGIVHYKDTNDMGKEGAKLILPLGKSVSAARKKLMKLKAFGGGDLPEAVLGGLQVALSRKMKWNPEANKVVILIGDAPPHGYESGKCVELVGAAYKDPGSQFKRSKTGPKNKKQRPYITSAIGVFLKLGPGFSGPGYDNFKNSQTAMRRDFTEIAKAGGGVFAEVKFEVRRGRPAAAAAKKRGKGKSKGGGNTVASAATQKIVEHILVLSFGKRFVREMRAFVQVFYVYKNAGLFK